MLCSDIPLGEHKIADNQEHDGICAQHRSRKRQGHILDERHALCQCYEIVGEEQVLRDFIAAQERRNRAAGKEDEQRQSDGERS